MPGEEKREVKQVVGKVEERGGNNDIEIWKEGKEWKGGKGGQENKEVGRTKLRF